MSERKFTLHSFSIRRLEYSMILYWVLCSSLFVLPNNFPVLIYMTFVQNQRRSLSFYCSLQFPFLVLLLSGGHGLLSLARGLENYVLLGTALDASPGDVLDKVS